MRTKSNLLFYLALAWAMGISAPTCAAQILEPNNTVFKATVLAAGQLKVSDNLNGNVGRPNTLLGVYDPAFRALSLSDNDSSPVGNGLGSQLLNVPLRPNGSAYFRITGAPDTQFNGLQTETGRYSVRFDLYDKNHNFIETLPLINENVAPGMVDNLWIDPSSDPRRIGGTVDVTVNNVVGPGTGDSLDFFQFSGLQPNQPFTARVDNAAFHALIGQFDSAGQLLKSSNPGDTLGFFTGVADRFGRALIGVTGGGDSAFKGEHADTGTYTVELLAVPEPGTLVLLLSGVFGFWAFGRRQRHA